MIMLLIIVNKREDVCLGILCNAEVGVDEKNKN